MMLMQFYNSLEVEFLPVYKPSEEEKVNPALYSSNVRTLMANKLGVPTTEHSYSDVFLAKLIPSSFDSLDEVLPHEFDKLRKALDIDLERAQVYLRRFMERTGKKVDKGIGIEELGQLLNVPVDDPLRELFDLVDLDHSGTIEFPEFLSGLALFTNSYSEASLQFVFEMFDTEKTGTITREQFVNVVSRVGVDHALFAKIDKENKGFVTMDDAKLFFKQHPEMLFVALRYKEKASTVATDVEGKKDQ